jgi:hypothetical protein
LIILSVYNYLLDPDALICQIIHPSATTMPVLTFDPALDAISPLFNLIM